MLIFRHMLAALMAALPALPASTSHPAANDIAEAEAVFRLAKPSPGLCLHLGCGRTPYLTVALAQVGRMPVHGLALDDAALATARAGYADLDLSGQAMVEKFVGKTLPYPPDIARLIVIEDMPALTKAGIEEDEILRVLAPGGSLCIKENGEWTARIKPRPADMDEWPQPHHGPDANMVSADRAISFPLDFRWIADVPFVTGGFASCASSRALVIAGGRMFTVNIDARGAKGVGQLIARDAFSGFPMWRYDCGMTYERGALDWRNVWPMVATDSRVYVARPEGVAMLDAANGKPLAMFATNKQPWRIVLADGALFVACWEKKVYSDQRDGYESDSIRAVWWPDGQGTLLALDGATLEKRWSLPLTVLTAAFGDGTLYVLTHKSQFSKESNVPTERTVIAINPADGKEKWRVPHTAFGQEADTCLNFAGPGCVVVSRTKAKGEKKTTVLDAADGKVRYSIAGATARMIVGDQIWCNDGRYDLKTGEKLNKLGIGPTYAGGNIVGGCVPPIVFGDLYLSSSRGGGYTKLPASQPDKPVNHSFSAVRGACVHGMIPANGMLTTVQNNCGCFPAMVGGCIAAGPGAGEPPCDDDFLRDRPIEKGPAFGKIAPPSSDGPWPTYRQNVERSGGTSANLPDRLTLLWKISCTTAPDDSMLQEAWHSRIGVPQPLTAPIVTESAVIVAAVDRGQIIALEPDSGKTIWRSFLPSRIDSPPTHFRGLLLIGCHDGWVYALRASDGAEVYRVRIAPLDRRMVAHGMVESYWPAVGAVLVYDGVAYAMAGRSASSSGGMAIVAFKPETGQMIWARRLAGKVGFPDALAVRDKELAWLNNRIDPRTGKDLPPDQAYYNRNSMIDGSWSGGYGRRSGRGHQLGRACSSMMAWNDKLLVQPHLAVPRANIDAPKPAGKNTAKHPDSLKPEELAWRTELKPHNAWSRVFAMAVTGNTALFAGSIDANGKCLGHVLWVKSMADGKSRQDDIRLDAPPAYDGISAGNGRLFMVLQDGQLVCFGDSGDAAGKMK